LRKRELEEREKLKYHRLGRDEERDVRKLNREFGIVGLRELLKKMPPKLKRVLRPSRGAI